MKIIQSYNPSYNTISKKSNITQTVICLNQKKSFDFYKGLNSLASNNIAFHGLINSEEQRLKKLEKELVPIKTPAEYKEVLNRIFNSKTLMGNTFWSPENDLIKYKNIKKSYIGLLPYCGGQDVSFEINSFLGGREIKSEYYAPQRQSIIDIIRGLDYSLNKLDKDFGQYKGIVYRKGVFVPNSGQFVSCSKSPKIAAGFNGYDPDKQYSMILTKTGHKIYDFQKKMKNSYADEEEEILLSRKSRHSQLLNSQLDESLLKAKKYFAECLAVESKNNSNIYTKKLTFYEAMDLIKVFKEI